MVIPAKSRGAVERVIEGDQSGSPTLPFGSDDWLSVRGDATRRPFGMDRQTLLEQDEEIGLAVEVDVDHTADRLAGIGIEVFREIDLPVEVTVRFTVAQRTVLILLLAIRLAIKVGVNRRMRQGAARIVNVPDVRSTIVIDVFRFDPARSGRPHGGREHDRRRGTRNQQIPSQGAHHAQRVTLTQRASRCNNCRLKVPSTPSHGNEMAAESG